LSGGITVASVYAYSDYRAYLRDVLEEKRHKNGRFSLRAAARKLGIGSGTLTRILNGTRRPGPSLLPRFIDFLGLRQREAAYFSLLIQYDRAGTEAQKRAYYQEILRLRGERRHVVPEQHYELFERWYHVALHQLVRLRPDIDDPEVLGRLLDPPISAFKTRKALEVLERNGFIRRREAGGYETLEPSLTTGEIWAGTAIHSFQVAMAGLGQKAIDRVEQKHRDISTLTLALSPESFGRIREIVRRARQEILAVEEAETEPKSVYQLNMQLFPLSRHEEPEGGDHEDA
jgi:uncharacterized protein (TIGR02147 family)